MPEVRFSAEAKKAISKVSGMTNPRDALRLLAGLAGTFIQEEEYTTRYDTKTGEPKETKWKPVGSWNGDHETPWNGELGPICWELFRKPIYKKMMALLPENKVLLIELADKKVVVTKTKFVSDDQGDMPAYLQFRVAKVL